MKNLNEYLNTVNENIAVDDVLNIIENLLNTHLKGKSFDIDIKEIFDINSKERQTGSVYGFDTTNDLISDVAGYLIEVFVWTKLNKELFNDADFLNEWNKDILNLQKGSFKASTEMKPIVRRSQKGQYWDFELPGVDGKFEIKTRKIDETGKSGGYRYTKNQSNDKDLIYIYVKYKVSNSALTIDSIEVKRKK